MEIRKIGLFFILIFLSMAKISSQNDLGEYFISTADDKKRWQKYSEFINSEKLPEIEMADSIYKFALLEYLNKQYSKCRELCELVIRYNPYSAKPHILIGQAYAASGTICKAEKNTIKEGILWAAMDEWEMAITKGDEDGRAAKLIVSYSAYWPDEADFMSCFGQGRKPTLENGDAYYVKCWINRETTIRLKK